MTLIFVIAIINFDGNIAYVMNFLVHIHTKHNKAGHVKASLKPKMNDIFVVDLRVIL